MKPFDEEDAIRRLESGLDRWGSTLARWPDEDRIATEHLLAVSPAARRLHEAAKRVDGALFELMREDPTPMRRRVPVLAGSSRSSLRRIATWGSVGLAASLVVGFIMGSVVPPPEEDLGAIYIAVQDADPGDGGLL